MSDDESIGSADSELSEVDGETAQVLNPLAGTPTEDWDKTPDAIRRYEAAATLIPPAAIIGGDQYTEQLPERWELADKDTYPGYNELRDKYIKWNLKCIQEAKPSRKNKPESQCAFHKDARVWLLTFNHPNLEKINQTCRAQIKCGMMEKCTVGNEYNTNQGYHVHVFVAYKKPQRMITMINMFPTADIRSNQENATMMHAYCLKDCDDLNRNWYTHACKLPKEKKESQRKINCRDLQSGNLTYSKLYKEQPWEFAFNSACYEKLGTLQYDNTVVPRQVIYIWGPPGSGKTTYVTNNIIPKLEEQGIDTGYEFSKITYTNGFYEGISCRHKAVWFEEFRGGIPWGQMLERMGSSNDNVNIKGGIARYQPLVVIITSVLPPWDQYKGVQERGQDDTIDQFLRRISHAIQLGKRQRNDDEPNIECTWESTVQAGTPEPTSLWQAWIHKHQPTAFEAPKELLAQCKSCYELFRSTTCSGTHSSSPIPLYKT